MYFLNNYFARSGIRGIRRRHYEKKDKDLIEANKDARILVILHLFYPQSWKEIREYLMNLGPYNWDLCITFPPFVKDKLDYDDIKSLNPNTVFFETENAGYDIGPFLKALKKVDLSKYDIVIKAQSKGVRRKKIFIYGELFIGRGWFLNLFEGILGASIVHKEIDALMHGGKYAVSGAKNLYVNDPLHKENMTVRRLAAMGRPIKPGYRFFAGTCFASTTAGMELIRDLDYTDEEFAMIPSSRGLSLGHLMERYLIYPALEKGAKVCLNDVCKVRRFFKKPMVAVFKHYSSVRLFDLPYVYDDEYFFWKLDNKNVKYKVKKLRLGDLRYKLDPQTDAIKLEQCVPYRYMTGDKECYKEYQRIHEEKGFAAMTTERFDKLIESMDKGGYDPKSIIMVNYYNVIKDGQHRACYLASKFGLDHEVDVLEVDVLTKATLIRQFIPKGILMKRFNKQNHLE